jgi:hypothetical protein
MVVPTAWEKYRLMDKTKGEEHRITALKRRKWKGIYFSFWRK